MQYSILQTMQKTCQRVLLKRNRDYVSHVTGKSKTKNVLLAFPNQAQV